jgi:autotransporter-associated beta strand protein
MNTNKFVRSIIAIFTCSCGVALLTPSALAAGDIFDGYIQINGTWYNIGGVNDGRNNPSGSANASTRTLLSNVDFGTQTYGNFNLSGFQIYGWTSFGTGVDNSGANYKVWKSGSTEPTYSNFWNTTSESYYSGGDYTASVTGQSTGLIGDTFINGDTYNLKIQTYTVLTGDNAGSKFYERSDSFVVNGARQLITGSSNTTQSAAYNTSAAGGVVKQGSGSLTLAYDSSNASTGQKGTIYIDEGTVAVNPNGGVSGDAALGGANSEVHLGGEFGSASAKFALTDADGGLSISRNVVVRDGSSGAKTIAAENSSGTSTLSGGIYLDDNVTLSAASGGTLDLSGKLEDGLAVGGFAVTIAGNGTVVFSGATNNTGVTGYTVQSGAKLSMNKSSADAIQSTLTINSGGTAEFAASNQLGSGANIANSGTLATGSGSLTDSFNSLVSSGNITGNGTLTASTYTLSGGTVDANLGGGTLTVTGDTTLNGASSAGTVAVSGSGTDLTLGNSANRLATGADVTVALGSSIAFGANQTLASIKETGVNNGGTLSIASGATLTINGANKGTLLQGSISGQGGLTVAASGDTSLNLYGTQSYTGTTTVSGGKLSTGVAMSTAAISVSGGEFETTADNVLGNSVGVTIDGGTFTVGGSDTIGVLSGSGGTLSLGSGKTLTSSFDSAANSFAGTITGAGVFVKAGTGTLTLSGVNTYSGGTLLNGGTLDADNSSAFGTGSVTVGSGTTLDLLSHNITNLIVNNGGTISAAGTVSNVDAEAGTTTISGANSTVTQVSGTATVNVNASDVAVNSITGGTVNSGASGTGMAVASVSSAATVNVGGANARVATMSGGTVNANAAGLVVTNYNGGNIAVSNGLTVGLRGGSSSGVISGSGGVTKQSAGTLTLSGVNTYSGATTVEAGKLVVNGSIVSATTVQSGAALGGSGTLASATIQSGGTIDPGNSPGTLTLTNGLTWNGGGNYNWQIYDAEGTAGTDWDLIAVTGGVWDITGLNSGNPFEINLWSLSGITPDVDGNATNFDSTQNYTWEILTYTSLTGTFNSNLFAINTGATNGTAGFANNLNGGVFSLATDGNSLNLLFTAGGGPGPSPVPEPGTWAAAALLAGAAGYVRWRRRKQDEPKA